MSDKLHLGEAVLSRGQKIHITVPASVAFDLGKFQKALGNIAERLGCKPCLSGADCTFLFERDWLIDPVTLNPVSVVKELGH